MSRPFGKFVRYRKLRCGCDDCVAIAEKFVNVKFPTITAGNDLGNKRNGKRCATPDVARML
jgi:hypothetical protein